MENLYSTVWIDGDQYLVKDGNAIARAVMPTTFGTKVGSNGPLEDIAAKLNDYDEFLAKNKL